MIPRLDRTGWGTGALDPRPPIELDGPAARRARELLVELLVETLRSWKIANYLSATFGLPPPDQTDAWESYVRLLTLLDRLFRVELRRLTRAVRCENHAVGTWLQQPAGGRLDPLSSLRQPDAMPIPRRWRVLQSRRVATTPPNRVAASVLRMALERLRAARGALGDVGNRPAQALAAHGIGKLRRFLAQSPLGDLEAEALCPELLRAARRRRASWARIRSLWGWWSELQKVDLQALCAADSEATLSLHDSYEACVALSLVIALAERMGAPDDDDGLCFGREGVRAVLNLGQALPDVPGRPTTALLRTEGGSGQRLCIIEARNAQGSAADDTRRLLLLCARHFGGTGWLVSPCPLPEMPGVRQVVWPLDGHSSRALVVDAWAPLLDDLLGT